MKKERLMLVDHLNFIEVSSNFCQIGNFKIRNQKSEINYYCYVILIINLNSF